MNQTILVTGGMGFIGSNFVLDWIANEQGRVVNLDLLTYAGNPANLASLKDNDRHVFVKGDIGDRALVKRLIMEYKPRAMINFAAESHVDRSIVEPDAFIRTNVTGTFALLEEARAYWNALSGSDQTAFRFLHVSTDEVFGSLGPSDPAFTETTPYAPNSPYSASKAASDHLVRAYYHTYGLPTLTTNCSNNYGPYQFPEKLIPLIIIRALAGEPLPVYGDGRNIRDWLYVTDHCEAIRRVLAHGRIGETYNIGGQSEKTNLEVVETVCMVLDEVHPQSCPAGHASLVRFVTDRPGHDRRYAINIDKIQRELGWSPRVDFKTGIRQTVRWHLANEAWRNDILSGQYRNWIDAQYGGRKGL